MKGGLTNLLLLKKGYLAEACFSAMACISMSRNFIFHRQRSRSLCTNQKEMAPESSIVRKTSFSYTLKYGTYPAQTLTLSIRQTVPFGIFGHIKYHSPHENATHFYNIAM